ncbi:glycosyltransferase [Pontibacter mangrovi]|uniref:Glycosyltransferase n=1 Tax=Pontibacter mangrovi TaxID=2589816 RepID=A0A501WGI8_9BACT|nr:glycosyltransferase [Pontibacter mangrovi]TPE46127.1 glycosyltransferase [Pontibacter mangrovi]
MNVAAVTVTYSNRAHLLQKVVAGLIKAGINALVVVDNGSPDSNHDCLVELQKSYSDVLHLIRLDKNTGSANGYKVGMEYVLNNLTEEFIWLLDDDNLPEGTALEELKVYWCQNSFSSDKVTALLSYRNDRPKFKQAIQTKQPYAVLGLKNSFLGFHIVNLLKSKTKVKADPSISNGVVAVAPYGGLFFHRRLLSLIGMPDTNFYLYGDDYDFSYRITNLNGQIELISSSIIQDLETSFHLKKEKKSWNRFFKTNSSDRIFYSVRNGIWFEKHYFVISKIVYFTNMAVYLLLLLVQFLLQPKHLPKLKIVLKGVQAGIKGRK